MKRTVRDRNDAFRPAPVKRIDLDIKNPKRRIALIALLVAIAVISFGYFAITAFSKDPGWREITVQSETGETSAADFTFVYNLGHSGMTATAEYKAVNALYKETAEKAYKIFNSKETFEDVTNLMTLSANPNTEVTVDPALYQALAAITESGTRQIYLAPLFEIYHDLFFCATEEETEAFDPYRNEEVAEYFAEVCAFANDPASVNLELLENNRVILHVSEAYAAYAKENEIDRFLDLYWMKNAFVADYLADTLTASGYTLGVLSSHDGYARVLDPTGEKYSTDILDWAGNGAFKAAILDHTGPLSTVSLHDYNLYGNPEKMYIQLSSGEMRHPYLDPADGLCKAGAHDLVGYSEKLGCGDILLKLMPVYIGASLDEAGLKALTAEGIHSVHCADRQIRYTDPDASFRELYISSPVTYTPVCIGK